MTRSSTTRRFGDGAYHPAVRPLVIAVAVPILLAGGIVAARHWRATPVVDAPGAAVTSTEHQATYPLDDVRRLSRPAVGVLGGRIIVSRSDCSVAVLDPTTGVTAPLPVPHACVLGTSITHTRDGRYVRVVRVGAWLDATLYRRGGRRPLPPFHRHRRHRPRAAPPVPLASACI